jgi:hypothetical protein
MKCNLLNEEELKLVASFISLVGFPIHFDFVFVMMVKIRQIAGISANQKLSRVDEAIETPKKKRQKNLGGDAIQIETGH